MNPFKRNRRLDETGTVREAKAEGAAELVSLKLPRNEWLAIINDVFETSYDHDVVFSLAWAASAAGITSEEIDAQFNGTLPPPVPAIDPAIDSGTEEA